jgi:hypothetical protein
LSKNPNADVIKPQMRSQNVNEVRIWVYANLLAPHSHEENEEISDIPFSGKASLIKLGINSSRSLILN